MSLKTIKMLIMDVDGVLTDNQIIIDARGHESMAFDVQDGVGLKHIARTEIKVALISGRASPAVRFRARALGIKEVHLGVKNKLPVLENILKKHNLQPEDVCYIGDDLLDIPIMRRVGYAVAVRNARNEVKKHVHYITKANGGRGAVREVVEKILKAQHKWGDVLQKYL
jgi:3-deoxy-D-manno-octulosonate 8-phosphate phosphatase (KDO 8-P phosphatase)